MLQFGTKRCCGIHKWNQSRTKRVRIGFKHRIIFCSGLDIAGGDLSAQYVDYRTFAKAEMPDLACSHAKMRQEAILTKISYTELTFGTGGKQTLSESDFRLCSTYGLCKRPSFRAVLLPKQGNNPEQSMAQHGQKHDKSGQRLTRCPNAGHQKKRGVFPLPRWKIFRS